MPKKPQGPFEIRGRVSDATDETRLGTFADEDRAAHAAEAFRASGHYKTVTVVDEPTQTCLVHLDREEREHDGSVQESTDRQ
jgi:hypothetical protein